MFNVKHVFKHLHAQDIIFHVYISLQMLQISFFVQHQTSEAKSSPNGRNYTRLCPHQQNAVKTRGGNWLFEDKDGSVTWPRCGAAPWHSAQDGGKVCQRLSEDTK